MGGGQSQERVVNVEQTTSEDGAPKIIVRGRKIFNSVLKNACTLEACSSSRDIPNVVVL